jgi:hypothetical protein
MVIFENDEMHLLEMLLVVKLTPAERPASARRKGAGK